MESPLQVAGPTVVTVTEGAVKKVREFLDKENKPNGALRLYVTGGGCSGLSYGLAIEDEAGKDDLVIQENGVRVLIDTFSAKYVRGSVIDYVETLQGSGFKIDNPNVTSTCACGSSFHAG